MAKIIKRKSDAPSCSTSTMETSSHRALQVSPKPNFHIPHFLCICCTFMLHFSTSQHQLANTKIYIFQKIRQQSKNENMGQTLQFKIGREAKWLPISKKQISQTNTITTLRCAVILHVQEHDQDMANSSSPPNHKRTPLHIQLPIQQKKTRSDL